MYNKEEEEMPLKFEFFKNLSDITLQNFKYLNFKPRLKLKWCSSNTFCATFIKCTNNIKKANEMDPNCSKLAEKCRMRSDGTRTLVSVVPGSSIEMDSKPFLTSEDTWQKLNQYYDQTGKNIVIKDLFSTDADRFKKYRLVILIVSLCASERLIRP